MKNSAEKAQIEQRRKIVAANLLSGLTITKIAEAIGYNKATISRDAKAIYKEWKDDRNVDVDGIVETELARLERATSAIWPVVVKGDVPAITTMLKIMERKAKLLGLDKPIVSKIELLREFSDEEIQEKLTS